MASMNVFGRDNRGISRSIDTLFSLVVFKIFLSHRWESAAYFIPTLGSSISLHLKSYPSPSIAISLVGEEVPSKIEQES